MKNLKDADYMLVDGAAWFTIKNFSVRLYSTDEGIVCDIYPLHKEMEDAVASTWVFDAESKSEGVK